jgi:ABC-type glycerol-3-phosphate transport system permease component
VGWAHQTTSAHFSSRSPTPTSRSSNCALYKVASGLGLYDRWITIIAVQTGLLTPLVTWLMLAFVRAVPVEVEEAATVDGASRIQLFRYVLVPMLTPGMVAAAIFTAISAWNSYLVPVILGQSHAQTLTAFMSTFNHHRPSSLGGDVRSGRGDRRTDLGPRPSPTATAGPGITAGTLKT